ncbi:MAG: PAS domain-containing protein, partial [Deltaproteobacteria bacterium]|nr:PAS domain-containing protein [Deltaproteobacteria bacterium]
MEKKPFSEIFNLGRRSISRDLTVSLILLVILFEGILLLYVYNRQTRFLRRELEKKADDYAVNLAEVLVVPIWDFDDEQIVKIGVGFARNDVVDKIHIMDPYGKTLYVSRSRHAAGRRIKRTVNIMHTGRVIGRASLFLSLDAFELQLANLRNAILLVMVVSLIVIFITSGILLRIFMRKPLSILQDGIDRVAKGDYSYGFDEIRYWELSGIAHRFSEMAADIQVRENSLQEINRALQEEVAERKRAEKKIKESEAKSVALLDAMPDMMFQFSRKGFFLDYKGAEEDLTMDPEAFLGKSIREMLPEQIAGLFIEKLERALNTRQIQIFEYE